MGTIIFKEFLKQTEDKKIYIFLLSIIAFGLFYDSFIISLGGILNSSIVESKGFKIISLFRYIFHGIVMPSFFLICVEPLTSIKSKKYIFTVFVTIAFCILGIIQGACSDIVIEKTGIIRRYALSKNAANWVKISSLIVTIVPMLFLLIISIVIAVKKHNPYMLIGGIIVFIFSGLGGAIESIKEYNFFISMFGEVMLTFFLYLFIKKEKKSPKIIKLDE